MGRRLNTSTPTVIQTMLSPLSDSFTIVANDTVEQWYYVNTGAYSPDRRSTPLRLTPQIHAVDLDTGNAYQPAFASVGWYRQDATNTTDYSATDDMWPGRGWVRITAVEATTSGVENDYYCPSGGDSSLFVRKNIAPADSGAGASGQALCCVAKYVDPRDAGVTIMVRDTVTLATNKDATMSMLHINLLAPTTTLFNPLTASTSLHTFRAQVLDEQQHDVTGEYYVEWRARVGGAKDEVSLSALPCYFETSQPTGKGQGTDTVRVDAMYVEHLTLTCRLRRTATSALLPAVAHCTLIWASPRVDVHTVCNNGRVVNSHARDMLFTNIVNHKGRVLTDADMAEHLRFLFRRRISTSSTFTNMGWGQSIRVSSSTLMQTQSYSTPVNAEVYMLGAYEAVTTADGEAVTTDDGKAVYDRSLE